MTNIESRLSAIEEQYKTANRSELESYLQELQALEETSDIELTDILRIEELRQNIASAFAGMPSEKVDRTTQATETTQAELKSDLPAPIIEVFGFLRTLPQSRGQLIENAVAFLKLEAIKENGKLAQPKYEEVFPNENLPIYLDGFFADNEIFFLENPKMRTLVEQFAQRMLRQVRENYTQTLEQYTILNFNPEEVNFNALAANKSEQSLLAEAAQLLGYTMSQEQGQNRLVLTPRWKTRGNLESAINTRIGVGLKNLLVADRDDKPIRRPILRFIVVMADYMAKQLRG